MLALAATASPIQAIAVIALPLFFVGAWIFAGWWVSRLSGWHKLAQHFVLQSDIPGECWRFSSASMRWGMNYNNCLTIGSSPVGFSLSMPWLFRLSHPPLFIPWNEISHRPTKILWMDMVRFDLGRDEAVPFTVRRKLADQIQRAARASWPPEQIA